MTEQLGPLQLDILKVLAMTKIREDNEGAVVNQIAKQLTPPRDQSTVFPSVKQLLEKNFLKSDQASVRTRRFLDFTDRGVSYAIAFNDGIDVDTLLELHPYLDSLEQKQDFKRIIRTKEARKMMFVETCKYLVNNNLFDQNGKEIISQPRFRHYWITLTLELTRRLYEMNKKDSGTIDFAAWRKYVERSGIPTRQVDLIINLNT